MRATKVKINLDAIGHNLDSIKNFVGPEVALIPIVKNGGYGQGLCQIAQVALSHGALMLAVAHVEEGIELRQAGFTCPILALNPLIDNEVEDLIKWDLTAVLFEERMVALLSKEAAKQNEIASIHLKIDTGMGRLGLLPKEVCPLAWEISSNPYLAVQGLMTHLATADSADLDFAHQQLNIFRKISGQLAALGLCPKLRHAANSAAIMTLPKSYFEAVRPGIMIYGLAPSSEVKDILGLQPVLSFVTQIAAIRNLPEDSPISYGCTYVTQRPSRIAVLPVGYDDGYNRLLSNRGQVLIRGQLAPIVGRICMDMTMVDITDLPQAEINDQVMLIGKQGDKEITVDQIARLTQTIPHDVLCQINPKVPRVYYSSQQVTKVAGFNKNQIPPQIYQKYPKKRPSPLPTAIQINPPAAAIY